MKSLNQFLEDYAELRAKARAKQQAHLDSVKAGTQAELKRRKDEDDRNQLVHNVRKQVKQEYGIKD